MNPNNNTSQSLSGKDTLVISVRNFRTQFNSNQKTQPMQKTLTQKLCLFSIALLFAFTSYGQTTLTHSLSTIHSTQRQNWRCGDDAAMFAKIQGDTAIGNRLHHFNSDISARLASNPNLGSGSTTYTIPVVFHIIQSPTDPPVSYAQIQWEVAELNAAYQANLGSFTGLPPSYYPYDVNTNIYFKLACIAEPANGTGNNPTTNQPNGWTNINEPGVVTYTTNNTTILNQNVLDPTTYTPMLAMTNTVSSAGSYFLPSKYLNIYCVSTVNILPVSTGTTIAYGTFPWLGIPIDGVVIRLDCVGNNSYPTGFPLFLNQGSVLAHEVGHYLGLYHPFQPQNPIGTFTVPLSCYGTTPTDATLQGDLLHDTPPTQINGDISPLTAINSCLETNTPYSNYTSVPNHTLVDQPDQLENYMCYSNDYKLTTFTTDQTNRMVAALTSTVASRDNLWSTPNLNSIFGISGCDNQTGIVTGIFNYSMGTASTCSAVVINFQNPTSYGFSTGSGTTYNWNFGDGGTSTSPSPSHTYSPSPGTYTASCTATNGGVTNTYTAAISASFNVQIVGQSSQTGSVTTSTVCKGSEQAIYVNFGIGVPSAILTDGTNDYLVINYTDLSHTVTIPYVLTATATASYSIAPGTCGGGVANINVVSCCNSLIQNGDFEQGNHYFATDLAYQPNYMTNTLGLGGYAVDYLASVVEFATAAPHIATTGKIMCVDAWAGNNGILTIPQGCNEPYTPRIWQQVLAPGTLQSNTSYYFSYKISQNNSTNYSCPSGWVVEAGIKSITNILLSNQTYTPTIDLNPVPVGINETFNVVSYTFTTGTISPTENFSVTINQIKDFKGAGYDYFLDNIILEAMTPGIQATANATICPTGTVQLNATANCAATTYAYVWTPTTALSCTNCPNPVASPTTTTIYTLVASPTTTTVSAYPAFVSTVTITVNPTPAITVSGNTVICNASGPPGSTTLTASGANTYTWFPSGSTANPFTVTPSSTTIYTVQGTGIGCSSISTQTIAVVVNKNVPTISVTPSYTTLCSNNTNVTLTASSNYTPTTYSWEPASSLATNTTATVSASPTASTIYTVSGTYLGCVGTNTISVTITASPTITVLANPPSVCPGGSSTLTASGATTYSWNTGATTPSIVVTPTVIVVTYYVTGSYTNGCTSNASIPVFVIQDYTVAAAVSPTVVCIGNTATLSTSPYISGGTYTWQPSGNIVGSNTNATAAADPTVTTSYTVSTSNGCFSHTATVNVPVIPTPSITVAATPTAVCPGYQSTLTANGGVSYTWSPSAILSSPTGTTVIASITATEGIVVYGTGSNGCVGTASITVTQYSTPITILNSPTTAVCQGTTTTLTASGAANTYTWNTGVTGTTTTVNPIVTTTYSVSGTNTLTGCVGTQTSTVMVYIPTLTVSDNLPYTCVSQTATLTASGASTYTWVSDPTLSGTSGATVTASPSVTTTYTVEGTDTHGCIDTKTLSVIIGTVCPCTNGTILAPTSTVVTNGTFVFSSIYSINSPIITSGNITMIGKTLYFSPTASLTVSSGTTLTLKGCHLLSCNNMWPGIVVSPGGKLTIQNNTLIEDAVDAVYCNNWNTSGSTLTVNGAVFNKNLKGISIENYTVSATNFPATIKNTIFTSRSGLPFPLSVSTLMTNSGIPSLSSPYTTLNTYSVATLNAPYAGLPPQIGIYINNVGSTSVSGTAPAVTPVTYNGLTIGVAGAANKNLFDLVSTGVYGDYGSNVTIINSDFANTPYYAGYDFGYHNSGTGVFAINQDSTSVYNKIQVAYPTYTTGIAPGANPPANNCNFYNCVNGVVSYANFEAHVAGTTIQSTQSVSSATVANSQGALGIDVTSAEYYLNDMSFNQITNVYTGIYYNVTPYSRVCIRYLKAGGISRICGDVCRPQPPPCISFGYKELIGNAYINNNTIENDLSGGSSSPTHFVKYGIIADNVITCQQSPLFAPYLCNQYTNAVVEANNNILENVYNGITMNNWQLSAANSCQSESNFIQLVQDQYLSSSNPGDQYGINHANNINNIIYDNNVGSGFNSLQTPITGITVHGVWAQMNATQLIQCNEVSSLQRAFEFLGTNAPTSATGTQWMDNKMQNFYYGLFMNHAVIGTQMGTAANQVCDNRWLGALTPTFPETFNFNNSNLSNSVLYCRSGYHYTPVYNNSNPANEYYNSPTMYPSTIVTGTVGTTRSCPALPPGPCGPFCRLAKANVRILEKIATDSLVFNNLQSSSRFISKLQLLRAIGRDSTITDSSATLQTFVANSPTTEQFAINNIESQLAQGNTGAAQSALVSFTTTDTVGISHKTLLSIITDLQNNAYTSADSVALHNLALSCPLIYGTAVYQAIALYDGLYRVVLPVKDNCGSITTGITTRVVNTAGINNLTSGNSNQLSVYPNPSAGELYLSSDVPDKDWTVEISDVTGRIVLHNNYTVTNGLLKLNTTFIDGVYFVKVITPSGFVKQQKVIIAQ